MDPVTTAIVTALASEVTKGVANKSYQALRSLFVEKKGEESDVVEALKSIESKPDSKGRQATLNEEIVAGSLHQDADVRQLAQNLLDAIKTDDKGKLVLKQYNAENMVAFDGNNYGGVHFHGTKKTPQIPKPTYATI